MKVWWFDDFPEPIDTDRCFNAFIDATSYQISFIEVV